MNDSYFKMTVHLQYLKGMQKLLTARYVKRGTICQYKVYERATLFVQNWTWSFAILQVQKTFTRVQNVIEKIFMLSAVDSSLIKMFLCTPSIAHQQDGIPPFACRLT